MDSVEHVCPACHERLEAEIRERVEHTMRGASVGGSPAPVDEIVVSWTMSRVYACGMQTLQSETKSAVQKPCGNATNVAMELRKKVEELRNALEREASRATH